MESSETLIIDSDILIDHLRGFREAKVFLSFFYEKEMNGLLSVITVMELLSGKSASDPEKRRKIEKLLSLFTVVDVTYFIAEKAAEIRRRFFTNPIDSLIAATAIAHNCRLATCNINHYRMIEGLVIWKPYNK